MDDDGRPGQHRNLELFQHPPLRLQDGVVLGQEVAEATTALVLGRQRHGGDGRQDPGDDHGPPAPGDHSAIGGAQPMEHG